MDPTAQTSPPSRDNLTAGPKGPSHPCRLCGRIYERADHLNRHLKSHENARPHKCSRCPKSFNRVDLLNRHQAGHDRQGSDKLSIERGDRVAAACLACVSAKAKCQDQKPCARCQRRGITCDAPGNNSTAHLDTGRNASGSTVTPPFLGNQARPLSVDDGQSSLRQLRPVHIDGTTQNPTSQTSDLSGQDYNPVEPSLANHAHFDDSIQDATSNENTIFSDHPLSSNLTSTFLQHHDFSYLSTTAHLSMDVHGVPQDSYFSQNLDFGMWDIDLDSAEFPAFDNPLSDHTDQRPGTQNVSKRYAAFERSPWIWTPTQKDQALNDQHNLNLDEEVIPAVLTPASSPATSGNRFASCYIDSRQRDQMISLLFSLPKSPRPAPRFPSLSLLNSVIQVYFMQESFQFDSLIHIESFSPSKTLPQLLLAIVSAGSTLIAIPAVWKMGLALQEIVRHTVAGYWEEDNRNTRDLQALQAFMIVLDIGLWSGYRRNMELAESFGQPIIIMLRRAGAFAASRNDEAFVPSYDDSQVALESKWGKWIHKESFKRLVLHIFIHDTQASIGLQKPPLVSFTELKLSLPASRAIWSAASATEWRDLYLATQMESPPIPSFIDVMQRPENLPQLASRIDVHFTSMVLLHGYWGQISSLIESKKFFPVSKSTHRLAVHTSSTELYRDLSTFSQLLPSLTTACSEAHLLSELFMIILQVSPEDLQRFAGKFGEDEARKAGEEFFGWARTAEARIAVWHAGQVFRAARFMSPAKIRGFNAIALYFATLTLWVFGLMSQPKQPTAHNAHSPPTDRSHQDNVQLDGLDSLLAQVFRTSGQGIPGITVKRGETESFVELKDTDKILAAAREIFRNNYPVQSEPLPPLVENLGNLLRDLGTLPSSYGSRLPSETPV